MLGSSSQLLCGWVCGCGHSLQATLSAHEHLELSAATSHLHQLWQSIGHHHLENGDVTACPLFSALRPNVAQAPRPPEFLNISSSLPPAAKVSEAFSVSQIESKTEISAAHYLRTPESSPVLGGALTGFDCSHKTSEPSELRNQTSAWTWQTASPSACRPAVACRGLGLGFCLWRRGTRQRH